jgi:hypothetical protein
MSAVHITLAPLDLLALYQAAFAGVNGERYFAKSYIKPYDQVHKLPPPEKAAEMSRDAKLARPSRFGTETDRFGNTRLGMTEVRLWPEFAGESEALLERYDKLLVELQREHRRKSGEVEGFKGMYNNDAKGASDNGEMGARTEPVATRRATGVAYRE